MPLISFKNHIICTIVLTIICTACSTDDIPDPQNAEEYLTFKSVNRTTSIKLNDSLTKTVSDSLKTIGSVNKTK